MSQRNIVVIGSGVSGLTTALLLSKRPEYSITVASTHQPGDYDIQYASPWAGANYIPVSKRGTAAEQHERNTWPELQNLARNHPEAGIHFQRSEEYIRKKDIESATTESQAERLSPNPWWSSLFSDFRLKPKTSLRPGVEFATEFTSCLKRGVIFKRAVFKHITDAAVAGVHHTGKAADLVVNCTGLSASKLGGVEDKTMVPARGQIVIVRNTCNVMYSTSGTDDNDDEMMYIMARAAGGGTVLGGCYQRGNWESQPDPNLAIRIMSRCLDICPQLTNGKSVEHLDVIRHAVGLRPVREGGVRIEKENIEGLDVVHNYGHGGFGYQASYGCSEEAIRLIDGVFESRARL